MITLDQYVGVHKNSPDWTLERKGNAAILLQAVNALEESAMQDGIIWQINPNTGSQVSGETFGGFRPQDCPQGKPDSSHKQGQGIDVYDQAELIDNWLTDEILMEHGLYRESPSSTHNWCHLTTRAPGSGHRTFLP